MAPSINDVSTDLDSPPKFRLADIGDMPAENKAVIREHYADLAPVEYEGASSLRRLSHPICPLNKLSRPRLSTLAPETRSMNCNRQVGCDGVGSSPGSGTTNPAVAHH